MVVMDLVKKGAIITGGGSGKNDSGVAIAACFAEQNRPGINFSFAKALRARGCAVLIGDLTLRQDASQWVKSIEGDNGPKIVFQQTDVTVQANLERLFDVFAREIGGVPDIVVAGAGVYEASTPSFWDERDADGHYMLLDINVIHPIKLTRIAIRRMRQAQKPGVILHESSIVALKPNPVLPLYAVSKAALSHFVRCMAPLGAMCDIRVVAVAPGIVDTPLFRDSPQAMEQIDTKNDFLLPPEEVVKAMLALSTDTKFASGTVLEINDLGEKGWREVTLLNDPGPQGYSKASRQKAADAIVLVEMALKKDAEGGRIKASL